MSLNNLSKDELIQKILYLEKKYQDIEWEHSFCYCELEPIYCNQIGCKARKIRGKNFGTKYENCKDLSKCKECVARIEYAYDPSSYYCVQHMNVHGCNGKYGKKY